MDEKSLEICSSLVPKSYIDQSLDSLSSNKNLFNQLLYHVSSKISGFVFEK